MKKPNVLRTGNRIKTPFGEFTVDYLFSGDGIPYKTMKEAKRKRKRGLIAVSLVETGGCILAEKCMKL